MKKNKGGINMKFGKKAFGLIAATMALGIGTTQVFAATLTAKQTKNIANLDLTAKNNLCSSIYVLLFSAV